MIDSGHNPTCQEQASLDELIADHLAAELAAYHIEGAGEAEFEMEEAARRRLLRYRPKTVLEAGHQLHHLVKVAWGDISPASWELDELANAMTGATS